MKDSYCNGCNTVYVKEEDKRMLPLDYIHKHGIENLADNAAKRCSGCRPGQETPAYERRTSDME